MWDSWFDLGTGKPKGKKKKRKGVLGELTSTLEPLRKGSAFELKT